jgi:DNA modification methylase
MANIEITRTELIWPGKYDDQGNRVVPERVNLPFQVIETINESRASREAAKRPAQGTLFDVWAGDAGETFEKGWRNKLIWGDNLLVMSSLLEQFAGKMDLIYIDPPFATGADFGLDVPVGESGAEIEKAQTAIEEVAYRDTWNRGTASWISMMYPRLSLAQGLLSPSGSLIVHLDWRMTAVTRLMLDELLGSDRFQNEIVWRYRTYQGQVAAYFPRKHDNLLWYRAGPSTHFRLQYQDNVQDTIAASRWADYIQNGDEIRGDRYPATDSRFMAYYRKWVKEHGREPGPDDVILRLTGYVVDDVWEDIQAIDPKDLSERLGYPTQKPEALLARIINSFTEPNSLVGDFFVGSGTTAAVAEQLGRRWIAADLGRFAIHTTRKRLMGIEGCKPFDVLNLGKYERQYWQRASFGDRDTQERVVFEYLAFILRLYGAGPIPGAQHLHGKKGGAVVHIGAVDAPVTIAEVEASLDEAAATGQTELHILGWEWEMGLNDLVNQLAQQRHVRLKLLAIPREVMEAQAVDRGDIRFFELAHLDVALETGPRCALSVRLTDFAMSDADAIPEDVRDKITKWSDYVDYWAIDWDFRNDTFMNGWVAYRTRRDRKLPLEADRHTYAEPGTYQVAVKVVDIFGSDTTRVFPVDVGE